MISLVSYLIQVGYPKGLAYQIERKFKKGLPLEEADLIVISNWWFEFMKPFVEETLHRYYLNYAKVEELYERF